MERRILHADFNCFFAAVACYLNPAIRSLPVAVAGDPEKRHGIILAKNELAKKYGVKTGEAIWQARVKCPMLLCVAPDFSAYMDFSERGRALYAQYSDRVEGFGLDENWIDVTASTRDFADAVGMADEIRQRVRAELGVTVSIGVAGNKVFAKLGSDIKKPDAITAIPPDGFRDIVWPLPASDLLYVGRATSNRLARLGIVTIGDIARCPEPVLRAQLGKSGTMLHAFANGLDASPVTLLTEERAAKSVGNGITAPRDLVSDMDVYLTIMMLSESVAARLRDAGMRAHTVSLAVRDAGLFSFSRQTRLHKATCITAEIAGTAMRLFTNNYGWQVPVRSVSVCCGDLVYGDEPMQLSLFSDETRRQRAERAECAVDGIRKRFGYHAIGRAIFLVDERIGALNPKEENTVHPVGYLKNGSMADVIRQQRA